MPTPSQAYAAVANALAGIDPGDSQAVTLFYRYKFFEYSVPARALIADFLVGHTGVPSAAALNALKEAIALPLDEVPAIEAPVWDKQFGPEMEYQEPHALPDVLTG